MKQIFTSFNQITAKPFLLALALLAMSSNAWAETKPYYNGTTWYALYDATEYSSSTGSLVSNKDKTIHTYSCFAPNTGAFTFDSKLPGNGSYEKTNRSNSQIADPKDYGVKNYIMIFGEKSCSVTLNVSSSYSRSSSKVLWTTYYTHKYTYTYNYRNVSYDTGLNAEATSINAVYKYSSDNRNRDVYIKNVKVPLAQHIRLAKDGATNGVTTVSKTFDNTIIGNNSDPYTVRFRSFLTNGNITVKLTSGDKSIFRLGSSTNETGEITSSKAGKTYKVGNNACASAGGEVDACSTGKLGKIENYAFDVFFCPTKAQEYTGTVSISDGKNTVTVTLKGTGDKMIPSVVWSPNEEIFSEEEVLTATNPQNLKVQLSSVGNEEYVGCLNNTATMLKHTNGNKIIIKAHVTGNDVYADADVEKEITVTNLIKQYISWDNGGDLDRLKTTDENKTITLNARSTSNLPVSYRLEGEKKGLTLTKVSEGVWTLKYDTVCRNTTIVAMQGGNAEYAPAADYVVPVRVIDPTKECDMTGTLIQSKITLKNESRIYRLEVPSTIAISVNRTKTSWAIYTNGFNVEFYTSTDGSGKAVRTEEYSAGDINTSKDINIKNLDVKIKSVKLVSKASYGYDVTLATYTKQRYCNISASSLDFTANPKNTSSVHKLKVDYANYPIQLVCSNPKFTYTPTDFGDCGEYGSQEVAIAYSAGDNEGEDSGILYIYDNTEKLLQKCTLNASVSKLPQEVTSTTIATSYKSTDKVILSSVASSKLTDFEYAASPSGVAVFSGSELTFEGAGTIAITVTQPGNVTYKSASKTIQNIVVSAVTPDIAVNPAATGVKCYGTLSKTLLSGGKATVTLHGVPDTEVEGHFEWKGEGSMVNDQAGLHEYTVVFKPNSPMYNDREFTIPVDVARADAALAMADGSVDVTIPGDTKTLDLSMLVNAQTGDGNVTFAATGENASHVSINGSSLTADAAGEYTIVATAAETDYYASATSNPFKVIVNRRTPDVSTANLNTVVLTYGEELSGKSISGNMLITDLASDNTEDAAVTCAWVNGADKPAVGVTSAAATFTSAHSEWFEPVTISVPVTVNPAAAKTYAATATISEGQSLSEAVFVNATKGLDNETVDGTISWDNSVDQTLAPEVRNGYEFRINFASHNANYADGTGFCIVNVEPAAVWDGTQPENSNERVVTDSDVAVEGSVTLGGLTINAGNTVTVKDGATLTIGDYNSLTRNRYGNIIVEAGGKLNLTEDGGELYVNDFTLYSGFDSNKQPKSGQVSNQQKITAHNKAYFILDLDTAGVASAGWYTFTVPFPVDELHGITRQAPDGTWADIVNERNYAIMAYYEDLRANTNNGWKKFTGTLQPGQAYTITIDSRINTYRFERLGSGAINAALTEQLLHVTGNDISQSGWNGLGNGTMQYTTIDEKPLVQVFCHDNGGYYIGVDARFNAFAVGAAYFYQAPADGSRLNLSATDSPAIIRRAPHRTPDADNRFGVSLTKAGKTCDRLFVTCDDDATGEYTVGKDVQKMGSTTGTKIARMWTNAKGEQLCAIHTAYADNWAIVPLQLYTPADAEYTLALDNTPDEEVYLTRNGIVVWDLTMSEYTFGLTAGTDSTYALLVVRRTTNVATGVDQLDEKAGQDEKRVEKMIIDGQLFLLHDGVLYDAQGKKVSTK